MQRQQSIDDDNTLTSKSILEYLPNELIIIICNHLYCNEIIYAFSNLNNRFQSILHFYSPYHLNLSDRTIKTKLKLIEQLPLNIEHVKSLTLSNDDCSFINTQKYLSIYPIDLFYLTLQSLSLIEIDSKRLESFLFLLPNFQQLIYLSISNIPLKLKKYNIPKAIAEKILFEIKTLKYFTWNIQTSFIENNYCTSYIQKSTIEYFHFDTLKTYELKWLSHHTVSLKSVQIVHLDICYHTHRQETFDRLIKLKLGMIISMKNIEFIFEYLTGLIQLKQLELQSQFEKITDFIDGYQWEFLIRKYIPHLKVFKFFFYGWNMQNEFEKSVESFQTDFWLIEKRWFITFCFFQTTIILYTIPCIRNGFEYSYLGKQISTTATTINDTSNIYHLTLSSSKFENIILYHDRFTNVQSLTLDDINDNINYNELNRIINILSVKHIELTLKINLQLFCDILKYHPRYLSVEILYSRLREIFETKIENLRDYFQKIKSLKIKKIARCDFGEKEIQTLCYYFPDIQQLILEVFIEPSELINLLNQLKHLEFLEVGCYTFKQIDDDDIRSWILSQEDIKLNNKDISCHWSNNKLYISIE